QERLEVAVNYLVCRSLPVHVREPHLVLLGFVSGEYGDLPRRPELAAEQPPHDGLAERAGAPRHEKVPVFKHPQISIARTASNPAQASGSCPPTSAPPGRVPLVAGCHRACGRSRPCRQARSLSTGRTNRAAARADRISRSAPTTGGTHRS